MRVMSARNRTFKQVSDRRRPEVQVGSSACAPRQQTQHPERSATIPRAVHPRVGRGVHTGLDTVAFTKTRPASPKEQRRQYDRAPRLHVHRGRSVHRPIYARQRHFSSKLMHAPLPYINTAKCVEGCHRGREGCDRTLAYRVRMRSAPRRAPKFGASSRSRQVSLQDGRPSVLSAGRSVDGEHDSATPNGTL